MKTRVSTTSLRLRPNDPDLMSAALARLKTNRRPGLVLTLALIAGLLTALPLPAPAAWLRAPADQPGPEPEAATAGAESTAAEPAPAAAAEASAEAKATAGPARKDVAWLGISTVEASEALAAQLGLEPGAGLVITYVAPGSPAEKSGLQKNDVLVQFDDQSLVHPAQLRKLVRVRHEGDVVKLSYYRAGKRQTTSVSLGLTRVEPGLWENQAQAFGGDFKNLQQQLQELHLDETVRDQMRVLRQSLGNIKIDQKQVQEDIRRGMDQARKAMEEALHNVTNAEPVRKLLENLAHSGVVVDDKADVTVRSSERNVKSLVKSDESGTIVLVNHPKLYLTAHDKDGKLLFDGPVESAAEQAKVPRDLWKRVKPLIEQMHSDTDAPEPKSAESP